MSKGIVIVAQNNYKINYVEQAVVLALSLKLTNPNLPISIITNDKISKKDAELFDKIIEIPWDDLAVSSDWKIENRWKVYYSTPYDETIVMDTDIIVLENIDHWWKYFKNYDLFFTTNVLTYRNEIVSDDYYRKTFTNNKLPNLYTGIYYFKKSNFTQNFFDNLEIVFKNWEKFYSIFLTENTPDFASMDVCAAITVELLDCKHLVTNAKTLTPSFVHMKSRVQNWEIAANNWQRTISAYLDDDCNLKIGNHQQTGIFHYTEKDFVNVTDATEKYRKRLNDK